MNLFLERYSEANTGSSTAELKQKKITYKLNVLFQ